ncbi:MAG TPA: acyltransferase family protein [Burkholderiales bacterium]|nr:acyltransferase family protein [Burkholderiales bacterium]
MTSNTQFLYRPDVDGLRAIAILSVIGFHAFPQYVQGGFVGVDIFFVISGFLISGFIFKELDQGSFRFANFYARRIKRIFPALILVLSASLALGWYMLLSDEYLQLGKHIAAGAAFILNFTLWNELGYFDTAAEFKPLLHLWSLGVEEQFYLVWPPLLVFAYRRGLNVILLVVLIAVTSFALNIWIINVDPEASFYLPQTRFWELMLGAILCYITLYKKEECDSLLERAFAKIPGHSSVASNVITGLGALLVAVAIIGLNREEPFPGWRGLLPTVGTFLLIFPGQKTWLNSKILSHRSLVFVGLISYPLYMWHWPLLSFTRIGEAGHPTNAIKLAIIGLSFVLAWLTYRFIEKPIRSNKRNSPAIYLFFLAALVGISGLTLYSGKIEPRTYSSGLEKIIKASNDWNYPGANLRPIQFQGGTFLQEGQNTRKVLFAGDSNMAQYWPRIDKLISEKPFQTKSAVFAIVNACPPIPNVRQKNHPRCNGFMERVIAFAEQRDVDTVVLGANWLYYFNNSSYQFEEQGFSGDLGTGSEGSSRAYQALESMIAGLRQQGKKVYLVLNIPVGEENDPKAMIRRSLIKGGVYADVKNINRDHFVAASEPVTARLKDIARRTGAITINPVDYLCGKSICPSLTEDGEPIYKDRSHIRTSFARDHVFFLDETILKD